MKLKQSLLEVRQMLAAAGIEDASLEAELLLRHALKLSRVQLYLDLDRELSHEERETLRRLERRRLRGEPTAYITGHREFFGLDFYVDARVLIPRPESELLVEEAIRLAGTQPIASVAEVGTGCGAIAVSLALNLPGVKIYATDVSQEALEVARLNCERHGVADRVGLLAGDLLDPLLEPVDLIVANLPYVKEAELVRMSVNYEPPLALDGGRDGLDKVYRLCRQAGGRLGAPGHLLLEVGQGQDEAVAAFLRSLFPSAELGVSRDLGGIERVVSLSLGVSRGQLVCN